MAKNYKNYGGIASLIPKGKENAIMLQDLARLIGLSDRETKRKIQELRDQGAVILSSSSGGYFLPTSDETGLEDVTRYIDMMETQAKSRFVRIKSAKRWLREYDQVHL